ncbi:MAG: HAD family hydrolase [Clostridia bacterium]|nr:HAD family hydrolase [Clostridia bacterium]
MIDREPLLDIRLVAMDLDGTLLNREKEISAGNQRALIECETRGILVVPATGRSRPAVSALARYYGLTSPMISINGARVDLSPTGPSLLKDIFDRERAEKAFRILKESGVYFVVYCRDTLYRVNLDLHPEEQNRGLSKNAVRIENEMGFGCRVEVVVDDRRAWDEGLEDTYKMVVFCRDEQRIQAVRAQLEREMDMALSSSWSDNLEVLMPGAGKGRAIERLQQHYGLRRDQIMAFGDFSNDLEMLSAAGWPVAMGNAIDEVKAAAKIIAPNNDDDGVGYVLNKYVLGEYE